MTLDGLEVFPRLETTLPRRVPTLTRSRLVRRAGSTPRSAEASRAATRHSDRASGVGKTLLALRFIAAGLENGERCLHISFQETEDQVREKAAAAGWDWADTGDQLVIRHIPPVELDLDQVGALVRRELAPATSSASSSTASPSSRSPRARPSGLPGLRLGARRLRSRRRRDGDLHERDGRARARRRLGGLSFIFNNVFFLRYVEIQSELRRGLNILKMRQSEHAERLLEFAIDAEGITSAIRSKASAGCSAGARSAATTPSTPVAERVEIRPERDADHPAIAEVVRAAFVGHPDEVASFVEAFGRRSSSSRSWRWSPRTPGCDCPRDAELGRRRGRIPSEDPQSHADVGPA